MENSSTSNERLRRIVQRAEEIVFVCLLAVVLLLRRRGTGRAPGISSLDRGRLAAQRSFRVRCGQLAADDSIGSLLRQGGSGAVVSHGTYKFWREEKIDWNFKFENQLSSNFFEISWIFVSTNTVHWTFDGWSADGANRILVGYLRHDASFAAKWLMIWFCCVRDRTKDIWDWRKLKSAKREL